MIPWISDTEYNLCTDYFQRKKTMNADVIYGDIDIDSMHYYLRVCETEQDYNVAVKV